MTASTPVISVTGEVTRREPIRMGFGRGLLAAGKQDDRIVAICADLAESTQMHLFRDAFPERFVEVGVAEQNLVTVASGMAATGRIPFTSSYAAFSPGRNWEQIKTTAALNDRPVKIVGSHAGLNVGPDGATHQMLEDIALMRVMPNMVVVAPGDSVEAEKATLALAFNGLPSYLRLARASTPVFTTDDAAFTLGQAYILRAGGDVTLAGTGTMTYHLLVAAENLERHGVSAEVVHLPTIKPLDENTLLASVAKTGRVVSAEEAQIAGGFGGAIAEFLSERLPTPLLRCGIHDRYGESGDPDEVLHKFGLTGNQLARRILEFVQRGAGELLG
ncbi:transketolase family protein [Frankia sp. Cas3]|uniref:transketolase family protein n=1 Tax=Frankia sp. Cas3 TaxID=3073926 RepID=UPI002AD4EC34|nr:transketolase C-terminal domain-containing protein [Frankia sp. Cas3]